MSATLVTLGAGLLSGSFLPWLGKTMLHLVRGDKERADHVAEVEGKREAAELERLLEEIAQLRLDRQDKEALVSLLSQRLDQARHHLDRALFRDNTSTTIARILMAAVDAEDDPSRQMIAARDQARRHIDAAYEQLERGN